MGTKFISEIPDLMVDWDWDQNNKDSIYPNEISFKSRKRVSWICHTCGGKWNTQVKERLGCPYCSGFKALAGFNDLATTNPELIKEWDFEKNILKPDEVTKGSHKKVYWECNNNHSWEAAINSRVQGRGCPICSNKKVLTGFNDLMTVDPSIAKEWDYEKNGDLTPSNVVYGSKQNVWWICKNNHSYQTTVQKRHSGQGCPVCSNKKIIKSYNDFGTEHPELLNEWDFEKNSVSPYDYACFSRKKVWWICKKGHSWQSTIGDRSRGNGCPKCSEERRVSFPEKALMYYITKYFYNVEGNYRATWLKQFELDIYLPDIKVAVEYDGVYGHSNKAGIERDVRKNQLCDKNGVKLIRVREFKCPSTNSTSIDYLIKKDEKLDDTIKSILNLINKISGLSSKISIDEIDVDKDRGKIYSLIEYSEKENSLLNKNPNIAKLWHPTKNGKLTPEYVSYMSSKKVWWLGECGHEWLSPISYEVTSGLCPYCSNKRVLEGFNDLNTTNPELSKEWDYKKNINISPKDITAGSGKKIWWICEKGHSWNASIVSRNKGNGCPICSNRKVLTGFNDVASYQNIVKDWDYENNDTLPDNVCIGSNKKYFWECSECGYHWSTSPSKRVRDSGCPNCAKKIRAKTVQDTYVLRSGSLYDKRPDLIKDWDYKKNKNVDPKLITCGSDKIVWWHCNSCGYSWKSAIRTRTRKDGGKCPECAKKDAAIKRNNKILQTKGPLSITHPEIAAELADDKNNGITADNITHGSGKRLWWRCSKCGREWQAQVCERTKRNLPCCPKCNHN